MSRTYKILMAGAAALALVGCGGADNVASPGEGAFLAGPAAAAAGAGGTPPPGQARRQTARLASPTSAWSPTLRACQLPNTIVGNLTLPLRAGTIYSIRAHRGRRRPGHRPLRPVSGGSRGS